VLWKKVPMIVLRRSRTLLKHSSKPVITLH
jgi:hypothetical protein